MKFAKIILGCDYGDKRIGVACSDETYEMSFPYASLETYEIDKLVQIIKKFESQYLVLGWPGVANPYLIFNETVVAQNNIQRKILNFAKLIQHKINVTIVLFDESFSSLAATSVMANHREYFNAKSNSVKYKNIKDKISASIILNSFLQYIVNHNLIEYNSV